MFVFRFQFHCLSEMNMESSRSDLRKFISCFASNMLLSVTEVNIYYKSINFTGHILLLLQLIVIDL